MVKVGGLGEGRVRRTPSWGSALPGGVRGEVLGLGRASGLAPGKRQQASAVQGYGSRN